MANIASAWLCAPPLGAVVALAVVLGGLLACSLLELLLQPAVITSAATAAAPVRIVRVDITTQSLSTADAASLAVQ